VACRRRAPRAVTRRTYPELERGCSSLYAAASRADVGASDAECGRVAQGRTLHFLGRATG